MATPQHAPTLEARRRGPRLGLRLPRTEVPSVQPWTAPARPAHLQTRLSHSRTHTAKRRHSGARGGPETWPTTPRGPRDCESRVTRECTQSNVLVAGIAHVAPEVALPSEMQVTTGAAAASCRPAARKPNRWWRGPQQRQDQPGNARTPATQSPRVSAVASAAGTRLAQGGWRPVPDWARVAGPAQLKRLRLSLVLLTGGNPTGAPNKRLQATLHLRLLSEMFLTAA